MLEIASGTGQHAARFSAGCRAGSGSPPTSTPRRCRRWPGLAREGLDRVGRPLRLDVTDAAWPVDGPADAIFCANMIHIAPWSCCAALMRGAARHLATGGVLITYGPYLEDDVAVSPGNAAFDADLRARDPAWGLRRREDVGAEAGRVGLLLRERVAMPANNLLLVWARGADG